MIDDDEDREIQGAADRAEDRELLQPPADQRTVDAGSSTEFRNRQRSRKAFEKARREFWSKVFADPMGRAEIWRIIADECRAFQERFAATPAGTSPDPLATYFASGQQSLGLRLYHEFLVLEPEGVLLMHRENDSRFKASK